VAVGKVGHRRVQVARRVDFVALMDEHAAVNPAAVGISVGK